MGFGPTNERVKGNPDFTFGTFSKKTLEDDLTKSYEEMLSNPRKKLITLGLNNSGINDYQHNAYIVNTWEDPVFTKGNQ